MPSTFVLGPSRWLKGADVPHERSPVQIRQDLLTLASRFDSEAFILEDEALVDGETSSQAFRRLVQEKDVQAFLLFWPAQARLHGLEKELGVLLEWMELGWLASEQVYVLAERTLYHAQEGGEYGALLEKGNRTRYHLDLIAHDVRIRLWDDGDSLRAHALAVYSECRSGPALPWHEVLSAAAR